MKYAILAAVLLLAATAHGRTLQETQPAETIVKNGNIKFNYTPLLGGLRVVPQFTSLVLPYFVHGTPTHESQVFACAAAKSDTH